MGASRGRQGGPPLTFWWMGKLSLSYAALTFDLVGCGLLQFHPGQEDPLKFTYESPGEGSL